MESLLQVWWVFPSAILFATVAIAAGVSGALFFTPFFMLVVGLSPGQAVGAGLLTEVFGMGNGLRSYVKQKLVDYATARWLLLGAVPSVIMGALLAHMMPSGVLRAIFGFGLLILGGFILFGRSPEECLPGEEQGALIKRKSHGKGMTIIQANDETYEYPTCWRPPGVSLATAGGLLTGMISAGLPEISTTQLVVRCGVPPRVAIATSVFVLAITAVFGATIHALSAETAWYVVAWSIPGVLVGSTIGSRVGKYLPAKVMEKALALVFIGVGLVVLIGAYLS